MLLRLMVEGPVLKHALRECIFSYIESTGCFVGLRLLFVAACALSVNCV